MKFTGERYIPNVADRQMEVEHLQRYMSILPLVKNKVVLDAACGEGYGAALIAQYATKVYGIDIDSETISHAELTYKASNLEFICAPVQRTELPAQSIDVVVSFETIEHLDEEEQENFLLEVKRVLREDGFLIISTPDKYWYTDVWNNKNSFHKRELNREEFYQILKKYFPHVDFYYQKFEVISVIGKKEERYYKSLTELAGGNSDVFYDGKYIIGVCGRYPLKEGGISSVVFDVHVQYRQLMDRIISLQNEVETRNAHIQKLNEIIKKNDILIAEFQEKGKCIEQLQRELDRKNSINQILIEELSLKNREIEIMGKRINDLSEKEKAIYAELEQSKHLIESQKNTIRQLSEKERMLEEILKSDGWKVLRAYYKVRDLLFPKESIRRLFLKILVYFIKNPQFLKLINKQNFRKFVYYMKVEKISNVENRFEAYFRRYLHSSTKKGIRLNKVGGGVFRERLIFPKHDEPLVSIIVPVYNQFNYTLSCLKSILENTPQNISYEVLVADDESTDETKNIENYVENIRVIRNGINKGFLKNCNYASKYAKGNYIVFLNNDTNVQNGWLDSLIELMESDPKIGLVGSKLIYPDGRLQEAGGIIWRDGTGWNYGRYDDPEKPEYNYVKEVDYISGAAIMIRADLWREIGGFDERYAPAYFEDADLAFEVRKHGYKVVYQPTSVVVHFEGVSHGNDMSSGIKSYQIRNREKFVEKWNDILKTQHFENGRNVFLARDRSGNKRTILVIDHYVPHFDKDAGSRSIYGYIKLFVKLGYTVKFIGDNFYRHEPYTTSLQKMGVEVLYGDWYKDHIEKWLKENGQYIDFTYLNRPHISIKYIDLIRRYTSSKVIYYGHDLHYLRELREYEITKNKELLKSSGRWKEMECELFKKSDVVYYPSLFEVKIIKEQFPDVNVKAIPVYIFEDLPHEEYQLSFENRKDIMFVGGFNHRPNIDAVLWFVNEIWPKVLRSIPDLKFYIIGSNPPDIIKRLHSKSIVVTGFVTEEQLKEYYSKCKIAVVPLRYGAGVKGKVVEALFNQIPIITTSIGAEGLPDIEDHLIVVDDSSKFADKLVELYRSNDFLNNLSIKSRKYIIRYFSEEAALKVIESDFSK